MESALGVIIYGSTGLIYGYAGTDIFIELVGHGYRIAWGFLGKFKYSKDYNLFHWYLLDFHQNMRK